MLADAGPQARLLCALRAERARWEALLAAIDRARLTEPGVVGDWSVKDVLGHLTAYYRYHAARLRAAASGVAPTPRDLFGTETTPPGLGVIGLDEQNALIRAQYRALRPPVVLARWREASRGLEAAVAALPDDDLATPGRFAWAEGRSLVDAIATPTYRHARQHAEEVQAWLRGRERSGR